MRTFGFAAALFSSALLMFSIQPMVAKIITPLLGGAPLVWVTCTVVFQALLLAGYAYAHWARWTPRGVHLALLALPLLVLPIVIDARPDTTHPSLWLLLVLGKSVGAPFFMLATTGPLLQGWFGGRDPYPLYAASNLGSVVALAAYPALVEPFIGLGSQLRFWHAGYVAFVFLVALCAFRRAEDRTVAEDARGAPDMPGEPRERQLPRATWFVFSFVPSAYLMSVTTYITTDVAPIPLFWVMPLFLYLVTFILVFGRRDQDLGAAHRWLPLGLSIAAVTLMLEAVTSIFVHLATFFVAALVCHGRLAKARPSPRYLTEFYLWLSLGGVAGGLFNALVAPAVFSHIVEYPLALFLAALCRRGEPRLRWGVPLAVAATSVAVALLTRGRGAESLALRAAVCVPALLNYTTRNEPRSFAAGLGAMLLAGALHTGVYGKTLLAERNFFGVLRVSEDPTGRFHQIVHGSVIHGRQHRDPSKRREPLAYYHRRGPLGDVFRALGPKLEGRAIAAVGLGAGAIAAYRTPSQAWTFYEINPAVVRVAQDPTYFTFLRDAFPEGAAVALGDARLRLAEAKPSSFTLLVLDAFSSDAVPTHLLTREAMQLYLDKITGDGFLAFHVSNRYLDLVPVVARLSRDAGLTVRLRSDLAPEPALVDDGLTPSQWMVAARDASLLEPLASGGSYRDWVVPATDGGRAFTDDFSNVLSVYRF